MNNQQQEQTDPLDHMVALDCIFNIQELTESYIHLNDTEAKVTVPKHFIDDKCKELNIKALGQMHLGNHEVFLTPEKPSAEKIRREFCGLMWLNKYSHLSTLQSCCNIHSFRMFLTFQYGYCMYDFYVNEVVQKQDPSFNIKSSLYFYVMSQEYGTIHPPTVQEMDSFLSKVKIVHGRYDENIRNRLSNCVAQQTVDNSLQVDEQEFQTATRYIAQL